MPDPEVIRVMRQWKKDLLAGERAQSAEMARRWLGVERRLSAQMDALALEMANIQRDGGTVSRDMLMTNVRYRELLIQLGDELERYSDYAERTIEDRQRQLLRLGIQHANRAITTQGIRAGFSRLPIEAVEAIVGLSGSGSPLSSLLVASWPLAADGLTQQLVNGVALGYNPRKTARMMAQGLRGSQQRMEVIARTESLRVYRHANLESYKASGVVTSYKRLATHDSRVCAACLLDEGHVYSLDEQMPEHPQGRCTLVPVVEGIKPPTWKAGADWLEEQDQATQLDILGKGRYYAWQNGDFALDELVTVKPNAVWGDSLQVTPLRQMQGARPARQIAPQFEAATARLSFTRAPEKLMNLYGFTPPTDGQQQAFVSAIDSMPRAIQDMWGGGDVILAISPERYMATHQNKWIMLGETSATLPETMQHEFIHHIMGQARFREALSGFRPSTPLFRHATEGHNSLDEEITMILTKYHPEREVWHRNIVNYSYDVLNNGQAVTPEVAAQKANDVVVFLRALGVDL